MLLSDHVAARNDGGLKAISRLEIGEWQTREGETWVSYDVWADDVINLSPRDEDLNGSNSPAETSARPTAANRQPGGMGSTAGDSGEDLDELPF